jgi:hypothetical protein
VTRRFNPPPGWPSPPEGWTPPPDWQPDPSWPKAPPGWAFYVDDLPTSHFDLLVGPDVTAPTRSWFTKKRYVIPIGCAVLLAIGVSLSDPPPPPTSTVADAGPPSPSPGPTVDATTADEVVPAGKATSAPRKTVKAKPKATKEQPVRTKTVKPRPVVVKPKPKPKKTKAATCDPNYSGGCVPIASDVDCAGGSGNGPAYFSGTARVVGTDIYRLDADHDGYACEAS